MTARTPHSFRWLGDSGKFLLAASMLLGPCLADASPEVVGISLIRTVRVDRAVFDYTFSVSMRGDSGSYRDATLLVASRAPGTTVLTPQIAVGGIDAGDLVRNAGVFTIRQDRAAVFDRGLLSFSFRGTATGSSAASALDTRAPKIGRVAFYQQGDGIHGGSFPLEGGSPIANDDMPLVADVFGEITLAGFALLDEFGQVLASGDMYRPVGEEASPQFAAVVRVPAVPFRARITARGANGANVTWTSARSYKPAALTVKLRLNKGLANKGDVPCVVGT